MVLVLEVHLVEFVSEILGFVVLGSGSLIL